MILVTGSNGLIGSHLLYYLTSKGNRVRALVRDKSRINTIKKIFGYYTTKPGELFEKIEWAEGDVTDYDSLEETFADVTQVYHTAAYVSFNPRNAPLIYDTNIKGTANIVNICLVKKNIKLCHISSIAALGINETGGLINEETLWKPTKNLSAYSLSKYHSEMEVWRGITEGLNAVIVNPSVVLGPGDWDKSSAAFIKKLSNGFKYYTSGINGFVDVNDVAMAMITAMESNVSSERFIISAENLSYREIINLIARYCNNPEPTIKANVFILKILQKVESFKTFLFNTEPLITKDIVSISKNISQYSNSKSKEILQINYKSITESLNDVCVLLKKEKQQLH
jgi:dihydroflavonol-4-reductase